MKEKVPIYLADLTHTGPVISSEVFPLGIGLIGAHLLETHGENLDVQLYKFPQELNAALSRRMPKIVGFSNYSWNLNLSYSFAQQIKTKHPETVVVFGGPNYGLTPRETAAFWKKYPLIDFYVAKEGELAMAELVQHLVEFDFDVAALKHSDIRLKNCHFLRDGELVTEEIMPRLRDLESLPSPYLMGMMDKFFDSSLIPMIHTTRGCPFTCTFCMEGAQYYQKVVQRVNLHDELDYIATRVKRTPVLYITDANFGMFVEDRKKAETIAEMQRRYGYPKSIIVATGKNQKERVIEVASILNGALFVAASLQSTDEKILENIARKNISLDALKRMAGEAKAKDAGTVTELILGLPGDTIQTHRKSLRDTVDAGLGIIRMYQLIMLPQTELSTPESREKYGMVTRFRLMPRSYGKYEILGASVISIESEEICVASKTMPFEDYLTCREMDMTVEVFHNGGCFLEYRRLCDWLGYSWFEFLMSCYNRIKTKGGTLGKFYDEFRADCIKGCWNTREELENLVTANFDEILKRTEGTNEMSKAKAIAFFRHQEGLHEILSEEMTALLKQHSRWDETMALFLAEMNEFSLSRKRNVLQDGGEFVKGFHFDFLQMAQAQTSDDPRQYYTPQSQEFVFFQDENQRKIYGSYCDRYGATSVDSLGKLLMRSRMADMFRKVRASDRPVSQNTSAAVLSVR